jgi:hypothetical protein
MLAAVVVSTGTGVRRARKLAGWACAPARTATLIPAAPPTEETTFSKIDRIARLFYAGVAGPVKEEKMRSVAVHAEAVSRGRPRKTAPDAGDYLP